MNTAEEVFLSQNLSWQAAVLKAFQEHNVSLAEDAHGAKGSPRLMITSTEKH